MAWSVKKKVIVGSSLGFIVALIGACMVPVINVVVKSKVEHDVALVEGRPLYTIWRDLPIPIYMQFYLFDVVNVDEVLLGAKPYVQQRGPYTYKEVRQKYNIIHNSNGTVTYKQNRTFTFIPEMSNGNKESDVFNTPNPVFWTLVSSLESVNPLLREAVTVLSRAGLGDVFMKRTMKEIIFGYHDPLLRVAHEIYSEWFYTDFVGYFINKNATNDGVYTIFTGETDISQLGVIDKYNGSSYLNFWTSKYANMINGSDGTLGPPYREKSQISPAFASDICRSIEGVYSGDVSTPQGIKLWRYTAPYSYMANSSVNPDNIGFCTPQSKCLDTGMLNISTCQLIDFFHIPVALSFPHFYLAAERYTSSVLGLRPNKEEHETALDLDPYTGLVLQAAKRLQVNLHIKPIANITDTLKLTPVFMPIFWLNESAVIDDKNSDLLKSMLFTPLLIIEVLEIVAIAGGVLLIVISLLYGLYKQQRNRKENKSTLLTRNGSVTGSKENLAENIVTN